MLAPDVHLFINSGLQISKDDCHQSKKCDCKAACGINVSYKLRVKRHSFSLCMPVLFCGGHLHLASDGSPLPSP